MPPGNTPLSWQQKMATGKKEFCMAVPEIVWRNPESSGHRRLWNKARHDGSSSLYIVVRSGERDTEWEGLPNLEMIEGGAPRAQRTANRTTRSSA
jgi:hypothetical protein